MFPRLFHRRSTNKSQEEIDVTETFKTLILAKIDRLEQKHHALETEWADVYDKIMLLYDRTRKRIQAAKKAAGEEEPVTPAPVPQPVVQTRDDLLRLYDEQRRVDNGRSS